MSTARRVLAGSDTGSAAPRWRISTTSHRIRRSSHGVSLLPSGFARHWEKPVSPETGITAVSRTSWSFEPFSASCSSMNRFTTRCSNSNRGAGIEKIARDANFGLGAQPCEALYDFLLNKDSRKDIHAVHLCWTPPDCFSALTFSTKFLEPDSGGVRRSPSARKFGPGERGSHQP